MLSISPLSKTPSALNFCIAWCVAEWQDSTGLPPIDWHAEFQRIEDHPIDEVFVAFEGDTPVGMVWMLEHEGIDSHRNFGPWVSNLIVDPARRSTGIAHTLLAHIESYMAAGGDSVAYLLTRMPAIYCTSGWEVADIASLEGEQVFVMQKNLNFVFASQENEARVKRAYKG